MELLAQTAAAGELAVVLSGLWAAGWAFGRPTRRSISMLHPVPETRDS